MRRIKDSYNRENIAEAIILILVEIGVISNLGYFTTDNASTNNIIIKIILQRLRLNIFYPKRRRIRYLNYIINFAAKAFLFNYNKESFKDVEINYSIPMITLKVEIVFWRAKGPLEKLYNLIIYIRKTL